METKKIEQQFHIIRLLVAILIALVISFLAICLVSDSPGETMVSFLIGPFKTVRRMGNVVEMMIPLMFTGVSVSIMYSCNQINMASEGAFFLGGVASSYVAVTWLLPRGIHPALCILAGGLMGSLVCGIPALLYVKNRSLPVVSSLMINYVALYAGLFVINYIIRDPQAGYLCSFPFADSAVLPHLFSKTNIHFGLIIAAAVVVFGYFFLYRSKWGYSIRIIGKNDNFAKYSGINVMATIVGCQLLGGFIAGIGGAVEQLGMYSRFQYQQLSNHGFDGVLIAILAQYNPKFVPFAAFFLGYIRVGADAMARTSDVPVEIINIIQATIIIFVAAERFLNGWKHRRIVKASQVAMAAEGGNR